MSGLSARARAEAEQLQASDPAVSAFVAASAGSGKTKLLTDRVLRLLLAGAAPERILCLTFTKAAAAEMALRLQRRLGDWATADDATLDTELHRLGVASAPEQRVAARALFARVLDLPGGMRIGTIHAFCQSLLRRFPLEAQLTPHFETLEVADAAPRLRAAWESALAAAGPAADAVACLAGLVKAQEFGALVAMLRHAPDGLAGLQALTPAAREAAIAEAFGVTTTGAGAILNGAVAWPGEAALRAAAERLAVVGSASVAERARTMLAWLARSAAERAERWAEWVQLLFTAEGKPRAASKLVNATLSAAEPRLLEALLAEQERVGAVLDRLRAARAAAATAALLTLALPAIGAYESQKSDDGLLDFDDLIGRSSRLLVDPGAAWVLFKLDGGLDHLLIDEMQDTAPAQWRIADALSSEFFAGEGARAGRRTVFAVGDRKQSIYSFQGADPAGFDDWAGRLRRRVEDAGEDWREVTLDVSFRSTAPVLELVDAVFAAANAADGVLAPGRSLRHYADRAQHAGSVELWPLAPPEHAADPGPWTLPATYAREVSAPQRLADALAGWIGDEVSGGVALESRGRALAPGDVLVLVRRRGAFANALVRALKARGVPVAGLDRLVLTDQPAAADLLTLCDALLLPEDDLAFACLLTSPLGGLDDGSLMELAVGRTAPLWQSLRARAGERAEWRAAWEFFTALMARVDYAAPHELLAEALGRLGGRARLLGRLGPEAAEPIDELLNAALAYARLHTPSLQGFVHWLRASGAEVKRESEGAGHAVRVMTVHGAKGLQAPLVILPDTTALPPPPPPLVWTEEATRPGVALPLWAPRKEFRSDGFAGRLQRVRQAQRQEHNRLLYVALTRAEDRLVVCGWQPRRAVSQECWYELVRQGFDRLGAAAEPAPLPWGGTILRRTSAQTAAPETALPSAAAMLHALPGWAGAAPDWRPLPPPAEPAMPAALAPSRGELAVPGAPPPTLSPLSPPRGAARRRGELIHALLQHLPDLPAERRADAAKRFLRRQGLEPASADALAGEALAVLDHAALAPLFGPGSRAEVPLTGVIAGRAVGGLVDRLAVLPGRVLVADYKTNRRPPDGAEDTPVLYLRQMAAYRAVLAAVFADRAIDCVLIWTQAARVVTLPPALLARHAPGAWGDSA